MDTFKQLLTKMGQVEMNDGRSAMVHLGQVVWQGALKGDKTFVKILLDRLEGRPPVAEPELSMPETDDLIAQSLLQVYGPVTDEDAKAVAGEVAEQEKNAKWANGD